MPDPACLLCRRAAPRRFAIRGHAIHRCARCDLEFVWPVPSPEALAAVYAGGYFQGGGAGYDDYFGRERELAARKAATRLAALAALGVGRGRLLDVGCAAGYFLAAARARGFDVYGVEPSAEARAALAADLRPRVVGRLEACSPHAPFDVATLWDVLEHLPDPEAALATLRGMLRPGATVAVVVPVLGSLNTRLAPRTWDQYKPPEHLWYFSRRALRALLARTLHATVLREEVAWQRPHRLVDLAERRRALPFRMARRVDGALGRVLARVAGPDVLVDSVAFYARVGT